MNHIKVYDPYIEITYRKFDNITDLIGHLSTHFDRDRCTKRELSSYVELDMANKIKRYFNIKDIIK